jgi:hypothetical protein
VEKPVPGDYGYDEEKHGHLRVCGRCYELFEEGRSDGRNQTCSCAPREEERWPGYDFNERAILCRCCGLDVLFSGSRWAPYFCRHCKPMAMAVSIWNRKLIFPIGRHSMMHMWVPETPEPTLPAHGGDVDTLAESLMASIGGVISGGEVLSKWYPKVMARNFEEMGLAGNVELKRYVEAVVEKESPNRIQAFEGLCEFYKWSFGDA